MLRVIGLAYQQARLGSQHKYKIMADFKIAFGLTGHNEGGYANNPADHGGETYAGIARNFWPSWSGWHVIDSYTKFGLRNIDRILSTDQVLTNLISLFYKQNFWDVNKLDQINDQQLANNVYDFGVNSGVGKSAKTLQLACGVTVDGIIGSKTIACANSIDAKTLYDAYNAARTAFYHSLAQNPGQLQFLKSWMSRIKPYQS